MLMPMQAAVACAHGSRVPDYIRVAGAFEDGMAGPRFISRRLAGEPPSATADAEATAAASVKQGLAATAANTFTQSSTYENPYAPVSVSAAFAGGVGVAVGPGAHTGAGTSTATNAHGHKRY
eukprot:gene11733-11877_t